MACAYLDRIHDCIIKAFVLPMSGFPALAQDETVDDAPAVAPESAKEALEKFVGTYRTTLSKLNIKAAPDDPTCTKAFDGSREGEILGVRFDTVSITWSLPHDKLHTLATGLLKLAAGTSNHSSRELQSVLGKLNNTSQLYPALKTFTSEKRRSNDKLSHSIIRAAYIVAGALGCKLFVSWVSRRTDTGSVIADDLTHMVFSSAQALDKHTFRSVQPLPPPITAWMKNPSHDRDLGHNILSWMREAY